MVRKLRPDVDRSRAYNAYKDSEIVKNSISSFELKHGKSVDAPVESCEFRSLARSQLQEREASWLDQVPGPQHY